MNFYLAPDCTFYAGLYETLQTLVCDFMFLFFFKNVYGPRYFFFISFLPHSFILYVFCCLNGVNVEGECIWPCAYWFGHLQLALFNSTIHCKIRIR